MLPNKSFDWGPRSESRMVLCDVKVACCSLEY